MIAALERAGHRRGGAGRGRDQVSARWKRATRTPSAAPSCSSEHRERIDGVIVTLPNFGDERAIADTLRLAELDVPVLVQATPDTPGKMTIAAPPRQLLRQDVGLQQPAAVRHSVFADQPHTAAPDSDEFRADLRLVRRRLPRGERAAQPAHRLHRRAAGRLQHRPLQREDCWRRTASPSRPSTSRRSSAASQRMKDDDDRGAGEARRDQELCRDQRRAGRSAAEDGEARRRDRGVDEGDRGRDQRGAVLDVDGRVLRRGALHGDEHDEQRPDVERLRGGYLRRGRHARAATGLGNARARCSTGTTTTATIPNKAVCFHCRNLPKHFFADVKMDFQEIIAGTVGKENTFGTCVGRVKAGADELRALLDRRHAGQIARLCRRGRVHRRSAEHLRRRGRGARSRSCRSCCATSARTASSITWRPIFPRRRRRSTRRRPAIWAGTMHWHEPG